MKNTNALIGSKKIFQNIYCDLAISVRLRDDDKITTGKADKKNGISKAIIWWRALNPPMNGYLLLLAHENNNAINGKNPSIAKAAINPTSTSATTQPDATGINATTAAAVATNIIGANQNIGLSAPEGTIISFVISFRPSASNWKIPSTLPAYSGPIRNCILASNFRSTNIVTAAINAANSKPRKNCSSKEIRMHKKLKNRECPRRINHH